MNSQNSSLSRYILVVLCVSVVLTAIVLLVLNAWVKNKSLDNLSFIGGSYDQGYKDGYLAAREKYKTILPGLFDAPTGALTGLVQSVGKDSLVFKVIKLDVDEKVDGVSETRTALITPQTKIVKHVPLDPAVFSDKLGQWAKSGGPAKGTTPPVPYMETAATINDLKSDMNVSVTAAEDVRLSEEFTATQIILNE